MTGIPQRNEAAPYYFRYIDRIASDDIVSVLGTQLDETLPFLHDYQDQRLKASC